MHTHNKAKQTTRHSILPRFHVFSERRTTAGEPSRHIASTKGNTPLAALYRMYGYLVSGYTIGLCSGIEFFFNKPAWAVADIPDPQDPGPERYAVLAVLPCYMVKAFNRLIQRGLPRDSPFIMTTAMEDELKSRPMVLEKEPSWVARVERGWTKRLSYRTASEMCPKKRQEVLVFKI